MGVIVRQKRKGKGNPWYVFVNANGQRRSKCVGDRASAEKAAREIRKQLAIHGFLGVNEGRKEIFGKLADRWLHFVDQMREGSTWERYDCALKHVLPVFGSREIGSITRGEVRDFLAQKMGDGHSKSGIRLMRDVISGIFTHAIDDEIVDANPCEGVTKRLNLQVKDKKVEPAEVLNEDEVELFLDTCFEYYRKYHLFMPMACRTGMRLGELLAVRWSDVDFNSNFITVRRQYRRGTFKLPKGGKVGTVEMSAQLRDALLRAKKVIPLKGGPEFIFHNHGKVWEQGTVRKVFKKILKKAGLRDLKFHSLRHSCASILLSKGASIAYVAKQLRHSSPQITLSVYTHWVSTDKKSEANLPDSPSLGCSEVQKTRTQPAESHA